MPIVRALRADRAAVALLLLASLVACSDDDPSTADVGGTDVADTSGDDADASELDVTPDVTEDTDTSADTTDTDDAGDAGEDVIIPTGPLDCEGSTSAAVAPGTGATLQLEVDGGASPIFVDFLGRELDAAGDVSLTCGNESIVPEGFIALSPTFTLEGPQAEYARRYFVTIPFRRDLMPEGARASSLRVFYRPTPDGTTVQPVVANLQENMVRGVARFEAERNGTWQIGVAEDAGTPVDRRWTFRAITGVSMGASGATMVGLRNHESFDVIAPLGGPSDWAYLVHYIRDGGMGGFQPAPTFGLADAYTPTEEYEHGQRYDEWYYPTGEGTGGAFNRGDYTEIFLDLMLTFGNMVTYDDESPYAAPGLPATELLRTAAERCAFSEATCTDGEATNEGVFTIETGYFDDEFNPDGTFPVITFCDGRGSRDRDIPFDRACDIDFNGVPDETNEGLYDDPCAQTRPVDITFAVDVDRDGIRDPGEPIIRNFWEPYEDLGVDGVASADEPGYDPVTNPDPAGDDYDYVDNPFGTEGNWLYDEGEPWQDLGLDGVLDTPQLAEGGYDFGEGNGVFDYNPNVERVLFEMNGRHIIESLSDDELRRLTFYFDAGVRDLFNFAVGTNQTVGVLQGSGGNVRVYDGMYAMEDLPIEDRDDYDFSNVDFDVLGDSVYLRYGSLDASEEDICFGDGKHVGTVEQIANRLLTMLGYVTNRFPDGELTPVPAPYPQPGGTYFAPSPSYGGVVKYSIAFPPGYESTQCSDGIDNDGDGFRDGDDPDCLHADILSEGGDDSIHRCNDGVDNDADGLADASDADCAGGATSEWPADFPVSSARFPVVFILHGYGQTPDELQVSAIPFAGFMAQGVWPKAILVFPDGFCGEVELRQCNDGIDNDGDGTIDGDDDGCENNRDLSEGDPVTVCNDGVDNDRDGLVDTDDRGCLDENWSSEANCVQGNFYVDHAAWPDGSPDGPPYEAMFLDLIDHLDAVYPTRPEETFPEAR